MSNLKKALALILVFAFALSFAASAAFTDVKVDDDYAVEIGTLANLNILTGYEDGSYKPEGTLTRAEAAAVIFRMLSGNKSADMFKGATAFSDTGLNIGQAGTSITAQRRKSSTVTRTAPTSLNRKSLIRNSSKW